MRMRFLTAMVALASVFGTQQAFAKHSTTTTAANKKHHKKHAKKNQAATAGTAARQMK